MNLSLILNATPGAAPATPATATSAQGHFPAEMASFQDFLSLMGLSPLASDAALDLPEADAGQADLAMPAAMPGVETGNLLPPELPLLPLLPQAAAVPVDPALLVQPAAGGMKPAGETAGRGQPTAAPLRNGPAGPVATVPAAANAPGAVTPASLPVPPEAMAALLAEGAAPPQPARAQPAPGQATVGFELPLPAAAQPPAPAAAPAQQAAAQPVLAQLLQAHPRSTPRKGGEEAPFIAPAGTAAVALATETGRPATPAPILPVATAAAIPAVAADTGTTQPVAPTNSAPAATAERHDFTAVIDKLAEARELARPGRADMHLAHREFGPVSVQFELAGQALKVAMTSADPGFAPAVQQALADRPSNGVADAARADTQPQRGDSVSAASPSWQAGPQADGQRHDGQNRAQQARAGNGPVRANDADADSAGGQPASSIPGRDGSRFA